MPNEQGRKQPVDLCKGLLFQDMWNGDPEPPRTEKVDMDGATLGLKQDGDSEDGVGEEIPSHRVSQRSVQFDERSCCDVPEDPGSSASSVFSPPLPALASPAPPPESPPPPLGIREEDSAMVAVNSFQAQDMWTDEHAFAQPWPTPVVKKEACRTRDEFVFSRLSEPCRPKFGTRVRPHPAMEFRLVAKQTKEVDDVQLIVSTGIPVPKRPRSAEVSRNILRKRQDECFMQSVAAGTGCRDHVFQGARHSWMHNAFVKDSSIWSSMRDEVAHMLTPKPDLPAWHHTIDSERRHFNERTFEMTPAPINSKGHQLAHALPAKSAQKVLQPEQLAQMNAQGVPKGKPCRSQPAKLGPKFSSRLSRPKTSAR